MNRDPRHLLQLRDPEGNVIQLFSPLAELSESPEERGREHTIEPDSVPESRFDLKEPG